MLGFIIKAILVILVIGIAIEIMNSIATDISKMVYDTKKLINAGREVRLIKKGEEVIRTAIGINDRGELIVRDDDGNTEHIFSGEVSVRGIYGYV